MYVPDYLTQHGKPFEFLTHPEAGDSTTTATAVLDPASRIGRTVALRLDHGYRFAIAVIPATHQIDLRRCSRMLGGAVVELETESQLATHCPECDLGSLSPFGSGYNMLTLVDESLVQDGGIAFEANRTCAAFRMKWRDFVDLEHPLVGSFADPRA